jgi:2-methylcitrate dehydratase PrpD
MTNRNIWAGADAGSRGLLHAVNSVYREEATLNHIISDTHYGLQSLNLKFENNLFKIDNPDELIKKLDFKIYFGCAVECQSILEAINNIKDKHDFSSIKSITIHGQKLHKAFFRNSQHIPFSERLHNIQILITMLVLYGRVHVDFIEDSFINSPEFKKLSNMIYFEDLQDAPSDNNLFAKIDIVDLSGRSFLYDVDHHKGHYVFDENRISLLHSKWNHCLKIGCESKKIDEIENLLNLDEEIDFFEWFSKICMLSIRHQQAYDKV